GGRLAIFVSIVIAGLSAYPMQMVPIAMLFWGSIALVASSYRFPLIAKVTHFAPRAILAVILLVAPILFIKYGYQRAVAYYHWKKNEGLPMQAKYESLLPHYANLRDNGEYLRILGESLME